MGRRRQVAAAEVGDHVLFSSAIEGVSYRRHTTEPRRRSAHSFAAFGRIGRAAVAMSGLWWYRQIVTGSRLCDDVRSFMLETGSACRGSAADEARRELGLLRYRYDEWTK